MKVGYIRSSVEDLAIIEAQEAALHAENCLRIYTDTPKTKNSELNAAIQSLAAGDVLVVTRLDRLAKTIKGIVDLIIALEARSVAFLSIEDGVDTCTVEGRYLARVMSRLALMDKSLLSERTHRSLTIAKAKGRTGGRPPALTDEQTQEAMRLISSGMPVRAVAKLIGSNHATLYRHIGAKPVTPSDRGSLISPLAR